MGNSQPESLLDRGIVWAARLTELLSTNRRSYLRVRPNFGRAASIRIDSALFDICCASPEGINSDPALLLGGAAVITPVDPQGESESSVSY